VLAQARRDLLGRADHRARPRLPPLGWRHLRLGRDLRHDFVRRPGVLSYDGVQERAPAERRRVAPHRLAGLVDIAHPAPHLLRRREAALGQPVEGLGPPCGDPEDARPPPADPDRQRVLQGLGRAQGVLDAVVLAHECRAFLVPHARADLERLDELVHSRRRRREVEAVGLVLKLLPTRADPELETPARHVVDPRGDLGKEGGVPVGLAGDHRPETDR